jgi:hypothetical protein
MKTSSLRIAAFLSLVWAAQAAPIYNVNAGTLTYLNDYLGFGLTDTFSFSGAQPVSVQGSGATAVAYAGLQSLNTAFNLTLSLVIDDTGNETGPASANGTNYGGSQYIGTATLHNSAPIVLTAGHLTVSVPGFISGELDVCTPDSTCPISGGANPFDVSFAPLAGTLTVTFTQFNFGSTYTLTNAQFVAPASAAPEPAGWMLCVGGLGLAGFAKRKISGR